MGSASNNYQCSEKVTNDWEITSANLRPNKNIFVFTVSSRDALKIRSGRPI